MTPADIDAIEDVVWQIVGLPAWQIRLGYGSFVTMEFGQRVSLPDYKHPRGEWHLWIYMCQWRLTMHGKQVAHWEDDRGDLAEVFTRLEGRILESFVIDPDLLTTELQFADDAAMMLWPFERHRDDGELWKLFLPDGRVLALFPDGRWRLKPGNELP